MIMNRLVLKFFVAFCVIGFSLTTQKVVAQDVHFSQFYSNPLMLNPAMTGITNGNYRLTAIYRGQYQQFNGYETVGASFDIPALRSVLGQDHIGLGLQFFNDQSGDGNLNNLSVLGSVAYHKSLDRSQRNYLSIGIQGGYVQKFIDASLLCFPNQVTPEGCDYTIANNETIQDQNFGYADLNLGLLYSGRFTDDISAYLGGSYYHITEPTETFLGSNNTIGSRLAIHAGSEIYLNDQVTISPSAIYMDQTGATEVSVGTAIGYYFAQNSRSNYSTAIFLGSWYRFSEEIVILGGIDYNDFRFGISYDLVPNNFSPINSSQGGFEISVVYIGDLFSPGKKYPLIYCPRF